MTCSQVNAGTLLTSMRKPSVSVTRGAAIKPFDIARVYDFVVANVKVVKVSAFDYVSGKVKESTVSYY